MAKNETKKADDAPKQEVAVQQPKTGAVTAAMPDFMKQYSGQGGENVRSDVLLIPRIALLQATSPEVTEKGEKVGDFYHTVLEESLGAELEIVPLVYTPQLILWNPRENGGGILARATYNAEKKEFDPWNPSNEKFTVKIKGRKDPVIWETKNSVKESGLTNWGTFNPDDKNGQPAATEVYSFLCILPAHAELGPVIVAFQRSAVKTARKLLSRLSFSQAPFFGQRYVLSAVEDQNKQGDKFKNFGFKANGLVEDKEEFEAYRALYEKFKGQSFDMKDAEGMQNDAPEADENAAPVGGKVSEKF